MRVLIFIFTLYCLYPDALAVTKNQTVDLLAIPSGSEQKITKDYNAIQKNSFVNKVALVFTTNEAKALAKLGDSSLGKSLHIYFSSAQKLQSFRAWAEQNITSYKLEKNAQIRTTEEPLQNLQWGLKNNGGHYSVDVDDFTTKQLPAQVGEDIDLENTPAATKPITVAVLDSGIDINHPDLKAAIVRNDAECAALDQYRACVSKNGAAKCDAIYLVDHDGNGYPLDCNGWNFAQENDGKSSTSKPLPQTLGILGNNHVADYVGHGTHVAGIIAAQINSTGVAGVAPDARILPVRIISGEPNEIIRAQEVSSNLPVPQEANLNIGYGLGDIAARGVLYAVRSHANIINMSLGWPDPLDSELLHRILTVAQKQGILIVAAAGNDSTDSVIYPCRYDGVICVGAHGPDGALTFFSNYGYGVDILAPGWNILSTFPTGLLPVHFTDQIGYEAKDGTSMAAPFISGMLARLMGVGMSADEAYARLMLAARPTKDSQVEDPRLFSNASLSGNADLAASFKVAAQALILPIKKAMIRLTWDRQAKQIPFSFSLMDHWLTANNVTVKLRALNPDVHLLNDSWQVEQWQTLENKDFSGMLEILDDHINSELDFEVNISGGANRTFIIRMEIMAPIGPQTQANADTKILPLLDSNLRIIQRQYDSIYTVATPGENVREYLTVHQENNQKILELLVEQNQSMVQQGILAVAKNNNQIASINKIRDPKSGSIHYALIENIPAAIKNQRGPSQLTWLDEHLQIITNLQQEKVDNTITYFSEDFEWQILNGEWVPTWYSFGRIPMEERKAYNPWDPTANITPDFRMYFLAQDRLHSVALPTDYPLMVSLLPQTVEQKKSGIVSVILAKGDDYALEYATAELSNGAWQNIKPITLPFYHKLRGIIPSLIVSLDPSQVFAGTAFSGFVNSAEGPAGSRRSTLITPNNIFDSTVFPVRNFDSITNIVGVFSGSQRQTTFSLTKYEIQFHDLVNQKDVMATQKRFSFLPSIFSIKSFFPALLQDKSLQQVTGESRVPAIFVPGDFLYAGQAADLIAPSFDLNGQVTALIRPAKFHLQSQAGCAALPSMKQADAVGPSEFVFFCGDHFISVPLIY